MHDVEEMPERLASFLATVDGGRSATVTGYLPITGGYSRLMARADVVWSDGSTESFVLRGDPPPGTGLMETDRDLEWAVLRALIAPDGVELPAARYYDGAGDQLGTKCIVIDFCPGPSLQAVLDDTPDPSAHGLELAATMGRLHRLDTAVVDSVLERPSSWEAHLDDLIGAYHEIERTAHDAEPVLRYAARYLDANRPPPVPLTLVHGDFQPANIMVGEGGGHLLVDWELAHIGDPREDLGYYNIYSAASGPNLYAADPELFLARYREASGLDETQVNPDVVGYFSSLAAVKLWGRILDQAGAMARGENAGIMTSYTLNALTIGRQNFLAVMPQPGAT